MFKPVIPVSQSCAQKKGLIAKTWLLTCLLEVPSTHIAVGYQALICHKIKYINKATTRQNCILFLYLKALGLLCCLDYTHYLLRAYVKLVFISPLPTLPYHILGEIPETNHEKPKLLEMNKWAGPILTLGGTNAPDWSLQDRQEDRF